MSALLRPEVEKKKQVGVLSEMISTRLEAKNKVERSMGVILRVGKHALEVGQKVMMGNVPGAVAAVARIGSEAHGGLVALREFELSLIFIINLAEQINSLIRDWPNKEVFLCSDLFTAAVMETVAQTLERYLSGTHLVGVLTSKDPEKNRDLLRRMTDLLTSCLALVNAEQGRILLELSEISRLPATKQVERRTALLNRTCTVFWKHESSSGLCV